MKNIIRTLKYTSLGLVGAIALLVIWGFIEPNILNTETEIAKIPNLPKSWQGKQIGQISDFQIGLWGDNRETARRSVAKLIEVEPALVLISGDFIYHPGNNIQKEVEIAVDIVRPLVKAAIPTYAVLGNHDYGMSSKSAIPKLEQAEYLKTALQLAGIKVLENEIVELKLPNSDHQEILYLVGVGSHWANRDDVQKALKNLPDNEPRVIMMHNPESFEQFSPNSAPLAVAGHTHGGQIRIPGKPEWSWLRLSQKDEVYADGWARGYGKRGNRLYVNPGIGMSIIPVRLFCPPELTFFTLSKE